MKLYIALISLVVLECCYCSPCGLQYGGDEGEGEGEGEGNVALGAEEYEVNDKTHSIGGGFNLGGSLGLNLGHRNNGLYAGIEKNLNFGWDAHAGTKTTHLKRFRPLFPRFYNPYRY